MTCKSNGWKVAKIKIDLNNPQFQSDFFNLEKKEQSALLKTLKLIAQIDWPSAHKIRGLNLEMIISKKTKNNHPLYSLRFSQKYRAVVIREGEFMRFLSLHTDHDSAY